MKVAWCWKCKHDVVMLEENEYQALRAIDSDVEPRYRAAFHEDIPLSERKAKLDKIQTEWYSRKSAVFVSFTGSMPASCSINSHCLPNLGPLCTHCGKPLRTPQAKMCAGCNVPREAIDK